MTEEKRKVVQLRLNNSFLDKITAELTAMKNNNNKVVKIASSDKKTVLVISHVNNDMNKKKQ